MQLFAVGPTPSNHDTPVDINGFHVAHAHTHEGTLRKTAKQMGVTLEGKLHECKGCSMAKGIRMSILSKTNSREGSKPSVVGEDNESGQDREASVANSESASEDGESVSERTRSEIETSEAEAAAPITSGRAPTPTPRARGSQWGVP